MSRPKTVFITRDTLLKMLELAKKYDNLKEAYKVMVRRKECKPHCYQNFVDQLAKLPEYNKWRAEQKDHRAEVQRNILQYYKQGMGYNEICQKTGCKYTTVYSCIGKHIHGVDYKTNYEKQQTMTLGKAENLVNYWNKNYFEGRYITDETKQAFELLGLEIPCRQ